MPEREYPLTGTNRVRYSGKLWSSSPIAQEPLLLLAELASELTRATDLAALQRILSRQLRWILDFDHCTLAVRVEDLETEYLLFEITSPSKAKAIPPQKLPIGQGWIGRALLDAKPYFVEDLAQLPPLIISPPNPGWGISFQTRSLMLLPLKIGARTIGSLNFSSCTTGAYSIAWRNLANLLASQVGGQLGSILAQVQLKSAYEFQERIMESTTDAIYTLDLEGEFTFVNQRTVEITGYSVEELLGLSFFKLFYPEQSIRIQTLLLELIAHGNAINQYAAEIVRKDGSSKIISFNLAPLFLEGRISAIVSTAQDISDRQQAQAVLIRAKMAEAANLALESQVQARTRQLQQALDFEARIKRITDKVRDSLDESQIVEAAVQELALGLGVGCCNMALYNLEQGTSTISYEYAISIPASQGRIAQMADFPELYRQLLQNQYFQFCSLVYNPNRGYVAMLACPVAADNQEVMGDLWLINRKDHVFTESEIRLVQQVANQCAIAIRQARLYQEATAQVKELEKLNQLKDDFLSTVSHELRTPMSNIKMAIQMLKVSDGLHERSQRYLEILQAECNREIELINSLLDLQRLEAASYPILLGEAVNLQEWLPNMIESFRVRTQERQQTLQINLAPDLPRLVSDRASLERILAELLNNACKYTPNGGEIALSIYCSQCPAATSKTTNVTLFTIRNQAEIPATGLPHIFEKFYRVPNGDPWKQGGTGLGLALVKKLVEQLKGTIQVKSEGGWTTFTVQLPTQPTSE